MLVPPFLFEAAAPDAAWAGMEADFATEAAWKEHMEHRGEETVEVSQAQEARTVLNPRMLLLFAVCDSYLVLVLRPHVPRMAAVVCLCSG